MNYENGKRITDNGLPITDYRMNTTPPHPIRLLVAEDSAACRELLVAIFQNAPGIQVVGTARDGAEAVRLVKRLKPDVVTMDLIMPNLDGYEATRQIMAETPCPIVMVSGRQGPGESDLTFNALQAGALSVLPKPTAVGNQEAFVNHVRLMADVKVVGRRATPPRVGKIETRPYLPASSSSINLVVMAASTGGPGALAAILSQLPANFPVPILVVQHVAKGFGADLAAWLGKQTALPTRIAPHGAELKPGEVLVAPDHCHLLVNHLGLAAWQNPAPGDAFCPSADRLFESVATVFGATAVGVILTGMGQDGAKGLHSLRQTGARTIAQDEASSAIFGMPAAAIQMGAAETIQPLEKIAQTLLGLLERSEI